MARSISVKVPTALLIQQIEERIAQIDKEIEEYPAKREAFEKEEEAYKSRVANFVAAYLGENLDRIGYDYDDTIRIHNGYAIGGGRGNGKVELTFDTDAIAGFPERPVIPEKPNQREPFGREYATRKELLEKNLRILKMTSQEEVNASTYGAIMEIL
jgi:hypothetical protein